MNKNTKAEVVRVFVNENGDFGNPVGIILDENQEINDNGRQTIAAKIGFSESVFINNLSRGAVSIFNPKKEVDFAGHALVGTSYFISGVINKSVETLECGGGRIQSWQENDFTWIRASLDGTPPWNHQQMKDASQIEDLASLETFSAEHSVYWAWLDKGKGIVRARTFAPDWGIPEDEANGSGSMQLADMLGQSLEIHHGKGSIIYAKPARDRSAEVGGRVALDKSYELD